MGCASSKTTTACQMPTLLASEHKVNVITKDNVSIEEQNTRTSSEAPIANEPAPEPAANPEVTASTETIATAGSFEVIEGTEEVAREPVSVADIIIDKPDTSQAQTVGQEEEMRGIDVGGSCCSGCCELYKPKSLTIPLVDKCLNGNPLLGWWNMPWSQPWVMQEEIKSELSPIDLSKLVQAPYLKSTWGQTSAKEAARIMYKATRIHGVFEQVPEQFRGVFWFKGDGTGESLVSLQCGRWFEDELIYVQATSPFGWAWAEGMPEGACGLQRCEISVSERSKFTKNTAAGLPGTSFSYNFNEKSLKHAVVEDHNNGNLLETGNPGDMIANHMRKAGIPVPDGIFTGKFTLEEVEGVKPGSVYKRGCYWGVGDLNWFEFGSYHLTKIIDENGSPLEPYHSEFLNFIGDTPLYMWTGFANKEAQEEAIQYYEHLASASRLNH